LSDPINEGLKAVGIATSWLWNPKQFWERNFTMELVPICRRTIRTNAHEWEV